jgi:ATP/maltotriose-dependent transcriptional regulator MalT
VEKLEKGLGRGLVPVCAPPGFGKTARVPHWIRAGQRPVAWLSLDAGTPSRRSIGSAPASPVRSRR